MNTSFLEWLGPAEEYSPGDTVCAADFLREYAAPDNGIILQLNIGPQQLFAQIVIVEAAAWNIPAIGVSQEGYAHRGFVGTVADLLEKLKRDIDMMRGGYEVEAQAAIDAFLLRVDMLLEGGSPREEGNGEEEGCRLTITDPSGLSCVVPNNTGPDCLPPPVSVSSKLSWVTYTPYPRSFVDSDYLGLIPEGYPTVDPTTQMKTPQEVAQMVAGSRRVVCISGAGISVESGIPPFRSTGTYRPASDTLDNDDDSDDNSASNNASHSTSVSNIANNNASPASIWGNFDAALMTMLGFNTDDLVAMEWWRMKHTYLPKFNTALPNAAHNFFSFLEDRHQLHQVITQNIDSLHQKGGVSEDKVLELHGHMRGLICSDNASSPYNPVPRGSGQCTFALSHAEACAVDHFSTEELPLCPQCQQPLRTETVMFGQPLPTGSLDAAIKAVSEADLLFVIGTSLIVQPVNTLPDIALRRGVPLVMLNLDDTQYDQYSTALVREPAGRFLAQVMEHLS